MRAAPEAIVIGFGMREPSSRYSKAFLQPHHFQQAWHRRAWSALQSLADADEAAGMTRPIRPARLLEMDDQIPEQPINRAYEIGHTAEAEVEHDAAADELLANWQADRYAEAGRVIDSLHGEALSTDRIAELVARQEAVWLEAEQEVLNSKTVQSIRSPDQVADDIGATLKARIRDPDAALGLRTGWALWDSLHKGARPGRLAFTISPTGSGKTSFMLNLASRLCDSGTPGLYINLEMSNEDIDTRLSAIRLGGNVSLDALERGTISSYQVADAETASRKSGLHVTDSRPKTIATICTLLARAAIRERIQWACIDHLLEVEMSREEIRQTGGTQWKLHADWIRRIHSLAQRYNFAVEVVGQCGRDDLHFGTGREPSFARMQGATALLNHCDIARILWPGADGQHVVSIKKNRGGRTSAIAFRFQKTTGTWREQGPWINRTAKNQEDERP